MRFNTALRLTVLVLALTAAQARAADSFPPLDGGQAPRTLDELWGAYDPRREPLEIETVKAWEQDGIVCRVVRYQVGTFKGAPAKIAAFYAFPKGATRLPGLVQLHGGGQSASLDCAVTDAKRGYAGLSINWGGNRLNGGRQQLAYEGPNTDWGKLDATHPPQRNPVNHFAGPLTPDAFTLDAVESPRNSNWFLVLVAARRAITFLEQQPEVDPGKIGAYGHSMGGKLTTCLAGIDKRVKAAVPSCGGAGTILESQADLPGCVKKTPSILELACIADNAYIPGITCPILWLSPSNDFNAPVDNMAYTWRGLPDSQVRFSIAPHLNHRHTGAHALTQHLWFEQHLKGAVALPQTPRVAWDLTAADGIPALTVTPDASAPLQRVDVYYAVDPHVLSRFWRSPSAAQEGGRWRAACPVMRCDEPIFAYANVFYETPEPYRKIALAPGQENADAFAVSSRVLSLSPAQFQAAGAKATDKPERMIDDGSRGWQDWYQLNWGHPPLWRACTRKLKDPKWRGPEGARLVFEIRSETDNALVLTFACNAWGAFLPGKPALDYSAVKTLKGAADWQAVSVGLGELAATDPKVTAPLASWGTVTEFSFGPSGEYVNEGRKVSVSGKPWQGPREIRNLRWEGGEYAGTRTTSSALNAEEHQKRFDDAINKSLEQEKKDSP